jgi:hypothetical protein
MNIKLIAIAATALIVVTNASAGECPGRAGFCPSSVIAYRTPSTYAGLPVADIQGRGAPVIAKLGASKPRESFANYSHLYRAGRA